MAQVRTLLLVGEVGIYEVTVKFNFFKGTQILLVGYISL